MNQIRLDLTDFDTGLLEIPDFDKLDESDQIAAITAYFENELASSLGTSDLLVTAHEIVIRWSEPQPPGGLAQSALKTLQAGDLQTGVLLLRLALAGGDTALSTRLNLGMALSDLGELGEAIKLLKEVVSEDPGDANAWVSLGVAHKRNGDREKAINTLQKALKIDGENGHVLKNLGAVLCEKSETADKGRRLLNRASQLLPGDAQVWFGLGRGYEESKDLEAADAAYRKVLELAPYGQLNDLAKEGLSRISEATFREKSAERPDAVMYCLGAMERFDGMPMGEVKKISMEIAILGMSGLDVNDPVEKYTVSSLDGEFSGLHLLCIEYVGFKMFEPSLDLGFDLSAEYQKAWQLFQAKRSL